MTASVLNGKRILAVDDEPDVLTVLEQEIKDSYPNCQVDKATTYEKGAELINANTYDKIRTIKLLIIKAHRQIKERFKQFPFL